MIVVLAFSDELCCIRKLHWSFAENADEHRANLRINRNREWTIQTY